MSVSSKKSENVNEIIESVFDSVFLPINRIRIIGAWRFFSSSVFAKNKIIKMDASKESFFLASKAFGLSPIEFKPAFNLVLVL